MVHASNSTAGIRFFISNIHNINGKGFFVVLNHLEGLENAVHVLLQVIDLLAHFVQGILKHKSTFHQCVVRVGI